MDTRICAMVTSVLKKCKTSGELTAAWSMFMATVATDLDNETFLKLVAFYGDLLSAAYVREIAADSKKEED